MNSLTDNFKKKHDLLICVDSDGCAMNTMDIKHFTCFGPCLVQEWGLEQWEKPLLERWNEINLYSMTRGVNRFKGLALLLEEVDRKYIKIPDLASLTKWITEAPELSNNALQRRLHQTDSQCLSKALHWSRAVNAAIAKLPEAAKQPFPGVAEGLSIAHSFADIAVVSSANRDAVLEEWRQHHLLEHVDLVLAQDSGGKADCISSLLACGYQPDHVLMVGDAPGDQNAAKKNGVFFFPILVRQEAESWKQFSSEGLSRFKEGSYSSYGAEKETEFIKNLGN